MKDDSGDQLIVLAQMIADTESSTLKSTLNRYLPLASIVLVGFVITAIAAMASFQMENHLKETFINTAKENYLNQINSNLERVKKNTNTIVAFVEASNFVSKEEFMLFTKNVLKGKDREEFVAIIGYSSDMYIRSKGELWASVSDYLMDKPKKNISIDKVEGRVGGSFLVVDINNMSDQVIVYAKYLPMPDSDQGAWVVSGMKASDLVFSGSDAMDDAMSRLNGVTGIIANDDFFSNHAHENTDNLGVAFDNVLLSFDVNYESEDLNKFGYFKWILIGFSFIFTLLLCFQFVIAKNSARKLANLAMRRANELTSINSELTDEIMSRIRFQAELLDKTQEIQEANARLEDAQNQLIQQEKLASLGQLAAGVAHEINNPVGFINSNLTMLEKYSERALNLIAVLDEIEENTNDADLKSKINTQKQVNKYSSLKKNMITVISESKDGVDRVKQIVQDLKNFSRVDEAEWQWADLHAGIDSTLNIARNEIKYKAEVHKDFSELPMVECVPSQINQVVMNLVVNSAHAIPDGGNIYIKTRHHGDTVSIEVKDDGCGIPDDIIGKIFDPFFTTKEVGKGTGLGLSLSYGIIKKHQGDLTVESKPNVGTTFKIVLPIQQVKNNKEAAAHG